MSLTSSDNLSQSYPAIAGSVPLARRTVADFARSAGATQDELDEIRLAVSEALTNAVMHAYRGGPGRVYVSAALASGELWVLIADNGFGLQAGSHSSGLGVGLALISEITDGFAIVNRAGGGHRGTNALQPRIGSAARRESSLRSVERFCGRARSLHFLDDDIARAGADDVLDVGHLMPGEQDEAARVSADALVLTNAQGDQFVASQLRALAAERGRLILLAGPLTARDSLVDFPERILVCGDPSLKIMLHSGLVVPIRGCGRPEDTVALLADSGVCGQKSLKCWS